MTETARMYGGSLYDLAAEEGLDERILGELDGVTALLNGDAEYLHLLSIPSIPKKERCALLDEAFRGQVHLYVLNFLKILCEKGTLRELSGCARAYRIRYNQAHGILEATAISAVPLTEQQRAALAKILLTRPDILLLDEPTRGLDAAFKAELAELLHDLLAQGVTVVLVSHDVEFCAAYAQRCALFFDGSIASDGAPREFFALNRFYTTAANRMARGRLPAAVTAEDVIAACGGREAPPKERREPPPQPPKAADIPAAPSEKRRLSPRTTVSALVALLLIPLTLVFGPKLLGDRSYYAVSLLMVLEAMLPFFLTFERRKPRARELVVTAVLCALGVAGRAAFFMLPQCKPVLALTILAGAALGGETGFLVGAVTMLVSNILFSQGPWTPWQMLGMGLCGFLAGLAFRRGGLPRKREALCAYGAVSAFLVYGILLNAYSALLATGALTWQSLAVYCASGFAMDAVQAISTAIFLWFFTEPMLDKLERVKIKYGFM